jgi:hypothetical protein
MRRLSPITISLWALLVGLLTVGIFLVFLPRHVVRQGTEMEALTTPEAPPPPAPVPARPAPAPPAAMVEAPPPANNVASGADEARPPSEARPSRRALLAVNHNRRMQEADEQAFERLKLPEATRVAIRQLNEEHRRRTEVGPERPQGPDVGELAAAVNAREASLKLLLGVAPARDFDAEERAAIQRLRGKYRFEWGRQLRP